MKITLLYTLFVSLVFGQVHDLVLPEKVQKKVEKAIAKQWQRKGLMQKQLSNPTEEKNSDYFFFAVVDQSSTLGYAVVKRTKACRAGGCSNGGGFPQAIIGGDAYEYFDFLMLLDTSLQVVHVEVVNYQAQYGYEICNKRWLKQFNGSNGKQLAYGKDIQALSGATISASAITDDSKIAYDALVARIKQPKTMANAK